VKAAEIRKSCDPLQNHVPVKSSSGNRRKKEILRNPVKNGYLRPKNNFLKTGITNLGWKDLPINGVATWRVAISVSCNL
jgi:hypothetical protein